jgi:hypothetical protein
LFVQFGFQYSLVQFLTAEGPPAEGPPAEGMAWHVVETAAIPPPQRPTTINNEQ